MRARLEIKAGQTGNRHRAALRIDWKRGVHHPSIRLALDKPSAGSSWIRKRTALKTKCERERGIDESSP